MKVEKVIHMLVSGFIEVFCLILLLGLGYIVYDTMSIEKSNVVDDYILERKPVVDETTTEVDFSALQEINPDIVGWLTMDDTNIDYPILQGDSEYSYLNRDLYGNSSLTGSLYIGLIADRYFEDDYTIIYGHHIAGGAMLGALDYYDDLDYLNSHNTGVLITERAIYDLHVEALISLDAYDDVYRYASTEALTNYFDSDAYTLKVGTISITDKMLLLSTCGSNGNTDRTILILTMEER
jgi:sortase B